MLGLIYDCVTCCRLDGEHDVAASWLVFSLLVAVGLGFGAINPGIANLSGRWAPSYERSIMYGCMFSGYQVNQPRCNNIHNYTLCHIEQLLTQFMQLFHEALLG